MVYCSHCAKNVAGERLDDGFLCCGSCGRVLEDYFFAEEPTFVKNAAGQSKLSGNYVRTVQSEFSESRQRTLDRAYDEIKYLSMGLGVHDEHMADQALTFYKIALERNFTRGRKSEQVQAACLYIAFRHNNKPYLLIDFSIFLRIDVYVLGSVFLQLCEVLRLGEHPIVQKPVDPSLFIHRYTKNLIKRGSKAVSDTALTIVASMKRDWMQTGRKPSGLCGAAIYISALAHGIKCSKPDILANASNDQFKNHPEDLPSCVPEGANVAHEATKDGTYEYDDSFREDESETLSDIDDQDVDLYIHDEEGRHIKKILWEAANREYLEEQAAKEAIAAANKKAFEANFENCSEDLLAARELAASASEAVAKSRKEMKQRRANEAKNMGPAQSAVEAFLPNV